MNTTLKAAVLCLLPMTAGAQTALSQLKLSAGDDAVAATAVVAPVTARPLPAPQDSVTAATRTKLQTSFAALENEDFRGVTWGRLPLGVRYVSVPLKLMTCPGCVSYTALVPVGALTPTAPVGDPNKASYFILERSGEWINPAERYSRPITLSSRDVFAACGDIDALTLRAWTLPEAVNRVQACLDKAFDQNRLTRRVYWVEAQAGRFGVRACPPAAPTTCQAIMEVEGVVISVAGTVPAGDAVLTDLRGSLAQRGGKLYGFHAVVADKTQPGALQ